MRKALIAASALFATTTLSACGGAQNEAAEANETLGGDSNTMGEAVSDVNAADAAMEPTGNESEAIDANASDNADANEIDD